MALDLVFLSVVILNKVSIGENMGRFGWNVANTSNAEGLRWIETILK